MNAILDEIIAKRIAEFQARNPRQQTLTFDAPPAANVQYIERRIVEPRAPQPPRHDPLPERFRDMADGLDDEIARKLDDRRKTNTPKRQREDMSARIDGRALQRLQAALRALADAREAGTLPPILECLRTKSAVAPLLRKQLTSNGYYHIGETGEWSHNEPIAVALRNLMEGQRTAEDAAELAKQANAHKIREMENAIRFARIDGFFPTPGPLVARMLQLAKLQPGMNCLEPSAGKGDIATAIEAAGCDVFCIEQNYSLVEILNAKGLQVHRGDFLQVCDNGRRYDRVVMNPPFEKGQDAEHVMRAFKWLKPGGRLVAITGAGIFYRSDKKAQAFREFLAEHGAHVEDNDPEAFKNGFVQTGVATKMICVEAR